MFDKISDAAERLASNVSRRDFFGWAGKSALALAGAVTGLLALPGDAQAGDVCCLYSSGLPGTWCVYYKPRHGACACGGSFISCKRAAATGCVAMIC